MNRVDENTLVMKVEGPEIFNGLRITKKFNEDGLEMVRSKFQFKYLMMNEK